jgi:hypothetical protein
MFQLGIVNPSIDYSNFTLTAALSEKQIAHAKECLAEIVVDFYSGLVL